MLEQCVMYRMLHCAILIKVTGKKNNTEDCLFVKFDFQIINIYIKAI